MRFLALALVFTGSAIIAQRPPGSGRQINPSGIPRLIYPSNGGPPAVRRQAIAPLTVSPFTIAPLSAAPPLPVTPLAIAPLTNVRPPPPVSHPYHGAAVIVPYPVYYGGYYYDYDAPPAPPQGAEYNYGYTSQQPSPVVVLNQNFAPDLGPVGLGAYPSGAYPPGVYPPSAYPYTPLPDDTQTAAPPDTSQQVLFFIGMKDHTIFPAVAYWVDGDTLNYITNQGVRNRVSLDLVDVDFSKQLNQQRGVDFALPGMK